MSKTMPLTSAKTFSTMFWPRGGRVGVEKYNGMFPREARRPSKAPGNAFGSRGAPRERLRERLWAAPLAPWDSHGGFLAFTTGTTIRPPPPPPPSLLSSRPRAGARGEEEEAWSSSLQGITPEPRKHKCPHKANRKCSWERRREKDREREHREHVAMTREAEESREAEEKVKEKEKSTQEEKRKLMEKSGAAVASSSSRGGD